MILYIFNLYIVIVHLHGTNAFGFDSGSSSACGKPYRTARLWEVPCDLGKQSWCTVAGVSYPWHAVRRFIRENHGLMKRMYGEERHLAVLRAELLTNDIEQTNRRYSKYENEIHKPNNPRLLNQDDAILNTKFIFSEEPNNVNINTEHHLKQTTTTTTTESSPVAGNNTVVKQSLNKTLLETNSVYDNFSTITLTTLMDSTEETTEVLNATEAMETTVRVEHEEATATEQPTTPDEGTTMSTKSVLAQTEQLFQDMVEDDEEEEDKFSAKYKLRGVNACPVKEEVVAPFWANNTRGEILALLNLYPFEQYVHWEKCTFEYRQMYCRDGCRCEQQYRLHRLLAYDPNNECRGIFSDWFKFPSCCICKCYDMPLEFRVTSRSPRAHETPPIFADWYRRKYDKFHD